MARYKELLEQKKELEQQIEEARRAEAAAALEDVRKIVTAFGFSPEDIFGKRRKNPGQAAPAKYRNPGTGDTWSGRGRPPQWMKDNDAERFRIEE
ncbi:H-NS histone family protein [Paraburkholderia sediminicola]|uniref:H-NS histone family protein n=1 Tax=Paraburkholderia sediminicola TaxID=458836 RepID=UPI0038BDB83D